MRSLWLPDRARFLRWHEAGRGAPVLWLPGLGIPALASFAEVATHSVLAGRRALLVDPPGVGVSEAPAEPLPDLAAQAEDIAALIDAVGTGAVPVVGHSFGGSLAIALAHLCPDLVTTLVVAEGNLVPGGGAFSSRVAAMGREEFVRRGHAGAIASHRRRGAEGDAVQAFLAGAKASADPAQLHASATALVGLPPETFDRFVSHPGPRHFIYGALNLPAGPGDATPDTPDPARLEAADVAVHVVPEAGHLMMLDNPTGFATAIAAALGPGLGRAEGAL